MGQAQSFETDHAQLDDIHLLQLKKKKKKRKTFSLISTHIIKCCCEIRNTAKIEFPNSFWTVAGVFGSKTDVVIHLKSI